jgi:dihydrofolate reductase
MAITAIAAVANDNIIAHEGGIPWIGKYPEDLERFKFMTQGSIVVMGRKTFDSIGKPLKNRVNLIITRNPKKWPIDSMESPLELDPIGAMMFINGLGEPNVYIIGGEEIYKLFWSNINRIDITRVPETYTINSTTKFFPRIDTDLFALQRSFANGKTTVDVYSRK